MPDVLDACVESPYDARCAERKAAPFASLVEVTSFPCRRPLSGRACWVPLSPRLRSRGPGG